SHKSDPDERIAEAVLELEKANASGKPEKIARALKNLGLVNLTLARDLDLAMDNFLQSLTIEDTLGLIQRQNFIYIAITDVFTEVGNDQRSVEFLQQALNTNAETGNVLVFAFILNKFGKVNAALGNTEQAFANYELVLANKKRMNHPVVDSVARFNVSIRHSSQVNFREALRVHRHAWSIRRSL